MPATSALRRELPGEIPAQAKPGSRERLLAAAARAFCRSGYFAVSVEEIVKEAGVSRMTFYRHFNSKAALALELFQRNVERALPRFTSISSADYRDRSTVEHWIGSLFDADRRSGQLLRVFTQANVEEPDFTRSAQELIGNLIAELGQGIPAFAIDRETQRRRWLEAWLVIYEILDQSNHAARGAGIAAEPEVIAILADRFVAFAAPRHCANLLPVHCK